MKIREIVLVKTGVVKIRSWDDVPIRVNGENIGELLETMVEECKPKKDNDDNFAGSVTITVEMYGDFEDEE